jgi:hypothetical protein
MKILFLLAFLIPSAFAYECSIQTEFYRSLPVFLGTAGTLEITSEKILVLSNRGTGVQTESKGNVIRYFYPAERIETHIIKTVLENNDVVITTAPKYFNCNIRQVVLRQNKVLSLSYCSVDGCRHLNPEVCGVLANKFTEENLRNPKNTLSTISETEAQVKAMTSSFHSDSSLLMREYQKLAKYSPRILGVSMADFETEEGTSATFALLHLGSILSSETDYCRRLKKDSTFWKEDLRPSKFLKKQKSE